MYYGVSSLYCGLLLSLHRLRVNMPYLSEGPAYAAIAVLTPIIYCGYEKSVLSISDGVFPMLNGSVLH